MGFRFSALLLLAAAVLLFGQAAWEEVVVPAELMVSERDALPEGMVAALYNRGSTALATWR